MGWLERYQRGRRAALAEYGIGGGDPPQPWLDDPLPQPEWSDDPAPLPPDPGSSPGQADAVSAARVAELEAQLAGMEAELLAAREARAKDDRLIAELREMVDQDQACTVELEAQAVAALVERDQLMEVLKLPGMKTLLARQYDPDKPGATETEKRELNEFAKKVNVAYDLIKKDARAKKSDEAA